MTALQAFAPVNARGSTPPSNRMPFAIADVPALPLGVESPADLVGEWVIARCKGGYERKLVYLLDVTVPGIGWALPMQEVKRRSGGQNRGIYTRLIFNSYVFICCRWEGRDRDALRQRENVFEIITVRNQPQFAREITGFHLASTKGMLDISKRPEIKPGVRCRIIRGDLAGQEAWVDKRDGEDEVVLKISVIGQGWPTTVPIEDVELL